VHQLDFNKEIFSPPSITSVTKLTLESLKERETEHLENKDVEGTITLKIYLKETWRGSLQGYQIVLSTGQ